MPRPRSTGLAFALLALIGACNKPGSENPAPAAMSAAVSPPSAVPAAAARQLEPAQEQDRAMGEKLEHYIECINRTDSYVHESYEMLLGSLSAKRQVLGSRWPNLRATGVLRDNCYKGLDEADKLSPKLADLEQAAASFRAAVDKLEPLLVEGDRYYHQGADKNDKGAHGQELVKQVLAGFEEFLPASKQLRASVDKYNQTLLDNSLARVEKAEGRSLRYLCKKIMAEAKLDLDTFLDEKADPAQLDTPLTTYEQLDQELRDRAEKFPQERARVENLQGLLARGDFVLRDFKETARAMKAGKKADASRARESLLKSYNEMVDESNKLGFKDG